MTDATSDQRKNGWNQNISKESHNGQKMSYPFRLKQDTLLIPTKESKMVSKKRYTVQTSFSDFSHQGFDIERIKASKNQRQKSRRQMYKCVMVNGHEQKFGAKSKKDAIKKARLLNSTHNPYPRRKIWSGYRHSVIGVHVIAATLYLWSDSRMRTANNPWLKVEDIYIYTGQ